jgi:hypothetical protein
LGPREKLVTVRWRGREYLLGVAAGAVQRIDDVAIDEAPPAVFSAASPGTEPRL